MSFAHFFLSFFKLLSLFKFCFSTPGPFSVKKVERQHKLREIVHSPKSAGNFDMYVISYDPYKNPFWQNTSNLCLWITSLKEIEVVKKIEVKVNQIETPC